MMKIEAVDLTAITTPFGLLDEATQAALKAHGGPYEMWSGSQWFMVPRPSFDRIDTYRVRPAPVEPPKPREWWIKPTCNHPRIVDAEPDRPHNYIHVREVLE